MILAGTILVEEKAMWTLKFNQIKWRMRLPLVCGIIGLIFLSSCSTESYRNAAELYLSAKDSVRPALPPETSFNKTAGRGDQLFVMLRLDDGKELPFVLDTGTPFTVLDKSLESKLGKRLKTAKTQFGWLGQKTGGIYQAPKLYLGNTELIIGDRISTVDLRQMSDSNTPLMGILGMDCLRHYCIQLDFAGGKMRFLDPDHLDGQNLGEAFPLTLSLNQVFVQENLLGIKGAQTLIDSGDFSDGALNAKLFEQELQAHREEWFRDGNDSSGRKLREACFPNGVFGGKIYTNLILLDAANSSDPNINVIGLRFLARHLVTLNFPKRMLFLQRNNAGSLGGWLDNNSIDVLTVEAFKFLKTLLGEGKLPGWVKGERGDVTESTPTEEGPEIYPVSRTFLNTKNGDVSQYHYIVIKPSKDGAWKLQRAWRTDAKGHVIEEFPVP